MSGHLTFANAGRLGNWLFQCSAAMAYAWKHDLKFSAPPVPALGRDANWNPVYCQHLVDPTFDPNLKPEIVLKERGYRYQETPFSESWRGKNIVLDGFWQSEKYFDGYRDQVIEAFGFPEDKEIGNHRFSVACHVRRGDYLRHTDKHPPVTKEWYEQQMAKFPGRQFRFFSDDLQWVIDNFSHRLDCVFPSGLNETNLHLQNYPVELRDLIEMSWCSDQICSASTFSVWACILNRNPRKCCIFPKQWIVPGWQGTTAADWMDVVPVWPNFERA